MYGRTFMFIILNTISHFTTWLCHVIKNMLETFFKFSDISDENIFHNENLSNKKINRRKGLKTTHLLESEMSLMGPLLKRGFHSTIEAQIFYFGPIEAPGFECYYFNDSWKLQSVGIHHLSVGNLSWCTKATSSSLAHIAK